MSLNQEELLDLRRDVEEAFNVRSGKYDTFGCTWDETADADVDDEWDDDDFFFSIDARDFLEGAWFTINTFEDAEPSMDVLNILQRGIRLHQGSLMMIQGVGTGVKQAKKLLQIHHDMVAALGPTLSAEDKAAIGTWLARYTFGAQETYATAPISAYEAALGEEGMAAYRAQAARLGVEDTTNPTSAISRMDSLIDAHAGDEAAIAQLVVEFFGDDPQSPLETKILVDAISDLGRGKYVASLLAN